MVYPMKVKNPLTIEERHKLAEGLTLNISYKELGEYVGRCKSVVMREAKRLGKPSDYDPLKAQKNFESRQKLSGIKRGSPLYLKIAKEEELNYHEPETEVHDV